MKQPLRAQRSYINLEPGSALYPRLDLAVPRFSFMNNNWGMEVVRVL